MATEPHPPWDVRRLGECVRMLSGGTPSKSQAQFWGGTVPWVGPKDLHARFVTGAEESLTRLGVDNGTRLVPAGTVLVVVRSMALAQRLQISWTETEVAFNQDIKAMVPNEGLDARFLFYALWGHHERLHGLVDEASHGTKRLRSEALSAFDLPVPPLSEQVQIAETVRFVDEKIETNRRVATLAEDLAATLFRSWFVDFDPVRAQAAGEEPIGVPEDALDLFPDRLVDSETGPIPEGWTINEVGHVLDIAGGSTPSTKEPSFWGGSHAFVTPKDLSKLDYPAVLATERTLTDSGVAKISSRLLPVGTVLLSSRAPIGYLAIAEIPVAVNQGFIAIRPGNLAPTYVLAWLRENINAIKQRAGGTTFQEISKKAFRPIPMLVPPAGLVDAFASLAGPLHELAVGLMRESQLLTDLRDAVLPELVSGRIRLHVGEEVEAEAAV